MLPGSADTAALPAGRYPRWLPRAAGLLMLACYPLVFRQPYDTTLAMSVMITLMLTLSLNFVIGDGGLWSFAHAAFFGIGAYLPGILAARHGVSPWLGLPLGVAGTALLAAIIGVPIVRLQGYYLGVCTLAFGFLAEVIVREATDLTGGGYGIQNLPPLRIAGYALQGRGYFPVGAAALLLTVLLLFNLRHSPLGHAIEATRDNAMAAAAVGINVGRTRLAVFVLSAGIAAFAGWVHAFYYQALDASLFSTDRAFVWLFMVFIGGLGDARGVVIGTILLALAPDLLGFAAEWQALSFGLLMIVVALFAPKGLGGLATSLLRRVRA